jgi:heme/copper-type cytochrome/quinol oxidase subunit 4
MENKIVKEKDKKKKKKSKFIVGIVIIAILTIISYLEFRRDSFWADPEIPWYFKIIIPLVATGIVLLIGMFGHWSGKNNKNKHTSIKITTAISIFFTYIIFPGMVMIIILLGATQAKYPAPNSSFEENVTHSFSISANAITGAFSKITLTLFNLGKDRPTFWLWTVPVWFIIAVWLMVRSWKLDVYAQLDAQGVIDNLNEKDYQELEKYENTQKSMKDFFETKNYKTWIIIVIIILAIIFELALWFGGG